MVKENNFCLQANIRENFYYIEIESTLIHNEREEQKMEKEIDNCFAFQTKSNSQESTIVCHAAVLHNMYFTRENNNL